MRNIQDSIAVAAKQGNALEKQSRLSKAQNGGGACRLERGLGNAHRYPTPLRQPTNRKGRLPILAGLVRRPQPTSSAVPASSAAPGGNMAVVLVEDGLEEAQRPLLPPQEQRGSAAAAAAATPCGDGFGGDSGSDGEQHPVLCTGSCSTGGGVANLVTTAVGAGCVALPRAVSGAAGDPSLGPWEQGCGTGRTKDAWPTRTVLQRWCRVSSQAASLLRQPADPACPRAHMPCTLSSLAAPPAQRHRCCSHQPASLPLHYQPAFLPLHP